MAVIESSQLQLLREMAVELAKRNRTFKQLELYRTGKCPIPASIARAQVTGAYRMLMAFSQTNYGRLIIKAASSRMYIGGIRTEDRDLDKVLWGIWKYNRMVALSRQAHDTVLTHGRVFGITWPSDDPAQPIPSMHLETPGTVIIKYEEGNPYRREAALRMWTAKGRPYATLYMLDGIYKYVGPKSDPGSDTTKWEPRQTLDPVDGELLWPIINPLEDYGLIPVVEIATNQHLSEGSYGHAWGDFESSIGLLDRINVLEFLRLVIAFTSGFPIRAVIGNRILRDDEGNKIAPFRLAADVLAQLENPEAKIIEIAASDLKSFGEAIDHDTETLSGICQTPSYFLKSVPIQNVSADAIRASDMPLNARIDDHKPQVSDGWIEYMRAASLLLPTPVEVPPETEIQWINRESRSLAERADAATKLRDVLPWQAICEMCFDATQEQINRWESMRASDTLNGLLNAPVVPPQVLPQAGVPPANGNGNGNIPARVGA